MKNFLVVILLFLINFLNADETKLIELFISGPNLTIEELWKQVEERSNIKIDFNLNDEKKDKIPFNGLTSLSELINKTKKYYQEEYKKNIEITYLNQSILIMDPNIVAKEIESDIKKTPKDNFSEENKIKVKQVSTLKSKTNPFTDLLDPSYEIKENTIAQKKDLLSKNKKPPQLTKVKQNTAKNLPPEIKFNTIKSDYVLKPGDKIEISVWGETMDRVLTVRPDGFISYILIGEFSVVGKTFPELKTLIESKLSKYIISPNVSIIGREFKGSFVSILGAVDQPGRKVISTTDRVLDVLTAAGGLKYEDFGGDGGEVANLKGAYLSRKGELINVDFSKLIYDGDMSQNIPVMVNDFIYIPSSVGVPIYVTGEVIRPRSFPFRGQPKLIDAITAAGGIKIGANRTNISIVRGGMIKPTIVTYNYFHIIKGKIANPSLEPGDIIYVPPSTLTKVERLSTRIIPFLNAIIDSGRAKDTIKGW